MYLDVCLHEIINKIIINFVQIKILHSADTEQLSHKLDRTAFSGMHLMREPVFEISATLYGQAFLNEKWLM